MSRPCMSVNATTTVSIWPSATSDFSSPKLSIARSYSPLVDFARRECA